MFLSKLVGRTIKDTPRDAELPSHKFMLRAGYVKQYSAGIYGLMPLAMRAVAKIEAICRQEMNSVEGQEVKLPCLSSKDLWDESGRYSAIGKDMFRLKDRHDKELVLNMTHEEPVVHMARSEVTSHKQLPVMLYQIQNKFRDEPRPRGGLIRTREFIMKDAYSFHATEEDLSTYYYRVHDAYHRFFKRCGVKNFASVISDNGMFGGRYSHEFMSLVPTGEDTLITCSSCEYKANREIATSPFSVEGSVDTQLRNLIEVETPGQKTIEQLVTFINNQTDRASLGYSVVTPQNTAKAVLFQTKKEELVVALLRGDLDVEEQKLKVALQLELFPAKDSVIAMAGAVPGSTGPIGLDYSKTWLVVDKTLSGAVNVLIGANKKDVHLANFNLQRDFLAHASQAPREEKRVVIADIASARQGDPCPQCGKNLLETRGIEIGNIFHLGTKYSAAMNMTYLDNHGKAQTPIMGCYGIGITRLLPALIEEHHDDRGPILPITIAPFQVHLCVLNLKEAGVSEKAKDIYESLTKHGIEVLVDDRDEKPGSQFADADLIGIPLRLILSPKTLAAGGIEFKFRDNRSPAAVVSLDAAIGFVKEQVQLEFAKYSV